MATRTGVSARYRIDTASAGSLGVGGPPMTTRAPSAMKRKRRADSWAAPSMGAMATPPEGLAAAPGLSTRWLPEASRRVTDQGATKRPKAKNRGSGEASSGRPSSSLSVGVEAGRA